MSDDNSPLYVLAGFFIGALFGALLWRGMTARPIVIRRELVVRKEMDGAHGRVSGS